MEKKCSLPYKGLLLKTVFFVSLLFFAGLNAAHSQIIDESFEEAEWGTGMGNTTSGAVTITSTTQNSVITYYTGAASSNTLISTNTTPNSGVWWYSLACTGSDNQLRRVRSKMRGVRSNGRGYLITPVTKSAIVSVTFWASLGSSSSSNQLVVGINTNSNAVQPTNSVNQTNSTHSNYPFHWGHNSVGYSYQQSFSAANSSMQQFTYTGTFSGPARIGFFNMEAGTVYIDDIVVGGPVGANPTVTTVNVTPGKNIASIDASAFAGTPAPAMPLAYSGVIWHTANTGIDTTLSTKTRNFPPNINTYPGAYTNIATGLTPDGTQYYARAYAVTLDGEVHYGAIIPFVTLASTVPTLTTAGPYNILSNKATSGGTSIDSGGLAIIQKGICWSATNTNPIVGDPTKTTQQGGTASNFTSIANNLQPNTLYYVRAYAANTKGTGYGQAINFTTGPAVPVITVSPSSLAFGDIPFGSTTSIMSYLLSASNLQPLTGGNITVTAPAGYQVSLSSNSGFGNSVPVTYANGTITNKTVYVKSLAASYGASNGYVLHTGGGTVAPNADTTFITGAVVQDPNVLTNQGTDFWLGFGYQEKMSQSSGSTSEAKMTVYIATGDQAANVTVDIPGIPGWPAKTLNIAANSVGSVADFPTGTGGMNSKLYYTGISNRGVHVVSNNGIPVSVWVYIAADNNSASGSMVFPSTTWNSSYTVQAYGGKSNVGGAPNSFFFVIANEDSTKVTFTPSADVVDSSAATIFQDGHTATDIKYKKNTTYTITLNKGQIFNAMGFVTGSGSNNAFGEDLSGTIVKTSCEKKIAVFGGNGRCLIKTASNCTNPTSGSDNLIQQMVPSVAWGTKYFTVPTKHMENNLFRIYIKEAGTVVKVNGTTQTNLINNLYYEMETNQPSLIEADKPITVTQFIISCSGSSVASIGNNGYGDPEMIILSAAQQSIKKATVYNPTFANGQPGAGYINVVIKNTGIPSFRLDLATNASQMVDTGKSSFTAGVALQGAALIPIANAFRPFAADPSYSWAKFKVSYPGAHTIQSDVPFNAIAYGVNNDGESYGFNAGTAINNLSSIKVAVNPYGTDTSSSSIKTCVGNPVKLQIALPYQAATIDSIMWDSRTDTAIVPYALLKGLLTGTPPHAQSDGNIVVDGRTFYLYSSPVNYTFKKEGVFKIKTKVYGTFISECGNVDSSNVITVTVGHDNISFTAVPGACGTNQVTFADNSQPLAGTTIKEWRWDFGDNTNYTSTNTANPNPVPNPHQYPATGGYWAKLETRNSVGCFSKDSLYIDLSFNLSAGFLASKDTICAGSTVTFTDQSTSNAIEWDWDWGEGGAHTIVTGTAPAVPITHTFNTAGTYNVKLFVKNAAGCLSAVKDTNIVVIANPVVDFQTPPGICLGGSMQFTNLSTPTTGVSYAWDFNDPNASGSNPNTSTVQNPTHIYTSTGPFSVTLVVTDNHYGCTGTKIKPLSSTIYQLPTAVISAPTSSCLKDTVQFTDASTGGTGNTVTGWAWNFGEPSSGANNTSTLQNPKHLYGSVTGYTVTLTVTNDKGCVSSPVPHTITIKPIPNVVLAAIPSVCSNVSPFTITQASETTGMSGTWVYTGTGVSGTTFSPAVSGVGAFPIIATYNASNGCKHADTTDVTVMALPTPAFTVGAVTCEKSSITFTDNTVANSTSIQSWGWNFGDASSTVATQNANHVYASAGSYVVTLTVTNSNNCTASLPKTITVRNRPFASFTMPASVCLPSGAATFTNASTVADDPSPLYNWNFGDPNSSAGSIIKDPTHNYSSVGPFSVQLIVTSQYGCVKDTTQTFSAVHPEPFAAFTATPDSVCIQDSIHFINSSTGSAVTHVWDFGDGSAGSSAVSPWHTYLASGTYNVSYYYTDNFGCKSNTATGTGTVNPYPVMDAGPTLYALQGYPVQLQATAATGTGLEYLWTPSLYLNDSSLLNPVCIPQTEQLYTLRVTNAGGCWVEDTMRVKILKEPEIPNAFSPNGDGINDTWEIGQLVYYSGCTVEVFNRYGQKLFTSYGYARNWDGTHNGKPLPVGTYYYIINPKNGHKVISGNVTILR